MFAETLRSLLLQSGAERVEAGTALPEDAAPAVVLMDEGADYAVPADAMVLRLLSQVGGQADEDILIKPLHLPHLLTRLQEVMHLHLPVIRLSEACTLDAAGRQLITPKAEVELTEKEVTLLEVLHADEAGYSRAALLEMVWGYGPTIETTTLETHLYRLRKKLASAKADFAITPEEGIIRLVPSMSAA